MYGCVFLQVYENGVMSQHVKNWIVGSTALWRGPFGKLVYSTNQVSIESLVSFLDNNNNIIII